MALPRLGNNSSPLFIKCMHCLQVKNRYAFSTQSLQKVITEISNNRIDPKSVLVAPCIACAPQQRSEWQCAECEEWKGLSKFSKTQLKERDEAKCMECIKKQVDTEAAGGSSDEDDGVVDDDSEDEHLYSGDESTAAANKTLASSSRGPAQGGTMWTGRNTSTASAVLSSNHTARAAPSVVSSVAGGATLPTAMQRVGARPAVTASQSEGVVVDYNSDMYSEDDDEDDDDGWYDQTSTILSGRMQMGFE